MSARRRLPHALPIALFLHFASFEGLSNTRKLVIARIAFRNDVLLFRDSSLNWENTAGVSGVVFPMRSQSRYLCILGHERDVQMPKNRE